MSLLQNELQRILAAAAVVLTILVQGPASAGIVYVDADATGADDGSSWADAIPDIVTAMNAATSGDSVWVAEGTYTPLDASRANSITLKNGVEVYGGFDGTETSLDQRDIVAHVTTFSGDIGVQGNPTDNSHTVVTAQVAPDSTAVLDGFTITGGYSVGVTSSGAGIDIGNASPTLRNLTITGNVSGADGGGIYAINSTSTLTNVTISGNTAEDAGGGLRFGSSGFLTLTNVTVTGNTAGTFGGGIYAAGDSLLATNLTVSNNTGQFGGGIDNASTSTLRITGFVCDGNDHTGGGGGGGVRTAGPTFITDGTISNNTASNNGGGLSSGFGAATLTNVSFIGNSTPSNAGGAQIGTAGGVLTNCVFDGNTCGQWGAGLSVGTGPTTINGVLFTNNTGAAFGGAMYVSGLGSGVDVANATFVGNDASAGGAAISHASGAFLTVSNSIIHGNTGPTMVSGTGSRLVRTSLIEGSGGSGIGWDGSIGTDGGGNLDADPRFEDAPALDFHLRFSSPCINAADSTYAAGLEVDLDGNDRVSGGEIDMGVYEYQSSCPPGTRFFVDASATGAEDGSSWEHAFTSIRDVMVLTQTCANIEEIWVAAGTYTSAVTARDSSLVLRNGVALYGGFDGTETLLVERDWVTNVSTLSGEIGAGGTGDNSYHVVRAETGTDSTAVLDGFTITAGNADGADPDDDGGGLLVLGGAAPRLRNVTFFDNDAAGNGAGMAVLGGIQHLEDMAFEANFTQLGQGGGLYLEGTAATLARVTFTNNSALEGGGLYQSAGTTQLTDVTFDDNGASDDGGGMYAAATTIIGGAFIDNTAGNLGGGLHATSGSTDVTGTTFSGNLADEAGGGLRCVGGTFADLTLTGNTATDYGGAIEISGSPSLYNLLITANQSFAGGHAINVVAGASPTIVNATLYGNTGFGTAPIRNLGSGTTLVNSIGWGNGGTKEILNTGSIDISYCLLEGSGGSGGGWDVTLGADQGNNIDVDPQFVDAPGGNLRLLPASAAINTADDTVSGLPATDIGGDPRISGNFLDIGPYEFQFVCPPSGILYVDIDAVGVGNGTSWVDAANSLTQAMTLVDACSATEVWVADGTYVPTTGLDRNVAFELRDGVGIYGGFGGTETSRDQRDPAAHVTILSGDIGTPADTSDNSFSVVRVEGGVGPTAVLDGFTVRDGFGGTRGGGIDIDDGDPTLRQLLVTDNTSASGGGIYDAGGTVTIENVTLLNNTATIVGGGFYALGDADVVDSRIIGNSASLGGGFYSDGSGQPTFRSVLITDNTAGDGGGVGLESGGIDARFINVTIAANDAQGEGGGVWSQGDAAFVNTLIGGNTAPNGPEVFDEGGATYAYCFVEGSGGSGAGWDPSLGIDLGNNSDDNPLWTDPGSGDYTLQLGSPAINYGDDDVPDLPAIALGGGVRIIGGQVDAGAYERTLGLDVLSILDVGNDQGRQVRVTFEASDFDIPGSPDPVEAYALFRRIDELGRDGVARLAGWDFVASIPAFGDDEYSAVVPTLADSTIADGMHWSAFLVRATTGSPARFYESFPDSGYSVDNLAPGAPLNLRFDDPVTLAWDESVDADFDYFTVYGSDSPSLDGNAVVVGQTIELSLDVGGTGHAYFFVTATDFSGNEGDPASTAAPVGVDATTPVHVMALGASPNPFNPTTRIAYSVPREGPVTLGVYTVNGRRAAVLVDATHHEPGRFEIGFSPRALPSGVYFLRLDAGGAVLTEKLTLLK